MTWNIVASVTIDGVAYTNDAIGALSVDFGRNNVWDQQRASVATVRLIDVDNTGFPIDINDPVVIRIQNATNTADITIFTGTVSQVAGSMRVATASTDVATVTVTSVGPFASLSRSPVGTSVYPSENEGQRIERILIESNANLDVVDEGIYTLMERPVNPNDALTLVNQYAAMATGAVYETTVNTIGYANEQRRNKDVDLNGYFAIDPAYISVNNIQSQRNLSDVINLINIGYNNSFYAGQSNTSSIATYGTIGGTYATEIATLADATNLAGVYLGMRSYPKTSISAFDVRLDNPSLDATTLNEMLNVYFGLPISITGLPVSITDTAYEGFVEGWNISFDSVMAKITIRSSDKTYSYRPSRWIDTLATLQWNAVGATLTWETYD
jgi:hypothetical protein